MLDDFYNTKYLEAIPSGRLESGIYILREYKRLQSYINHELKTDTINVPTRLPYHNDYVECLALFTAFCKSQNINVTVPPVGPDQYTNIHQIDKCLIDCLINWSQQLTEVNAKKILGAKTELYSSIFGSLSVYEFSQDEFSKIQKLMNELRRLIADNEIIDASHKRRLLNRLEAMQLEMHKRTSDIDRFWGFIAESGIVAKKFGDDLKPITDRVTELGSIVIAVIMAKEGVKALPDITKLLGH